MLIFAAFAFALAQPPAPAAPEAPVDWKTAEAPLLSHHVQLTFPQKFVKAGEAYFDHQTPPQWIIFQAIPVPPAGTAPDANYSMYVAHVSRDSSGKIIGIEEPKLLSGKGSANTCGWFNPTELAHVIFGSTLVAPAATDSPGYSRDKQRYSWQFPAEMDVVQTRFDPTRTSTNDSSSSSAVPVFKRPGYDAECSFSKDGRFILYTHVDPTNNDPNIWVFDTKTSKHYPLITAKGYDGGPFFSPDNKWICYRSDRKGNNVLQLFIAELAFGDDGDPAVPIGISREIQLTIEDPAKADAEQTVSWCPFWHPSAQYLIYATSEVGHGNYEVFAIEADASKPREQLRRARLTYAPGFDGLPVFSEDGKLMMWTSQRGPKLESEQRPSSQLWIADYAGEPNWIKPVPKP